MQLYGAPCSCQGDTLGHRSFNETTIGAIFMSVNAIQNFLSHELTLVIHGYDQRMPKVDLRLPGL